MPNCQYTIIRTPKLHHRPVGQHEPDKTPNRVFLQDGGYKHTIDNNEFGEIKSATVPSIVPSLADIDLGFEIN